MKHIFIITLIILVLLGIVAGVWFWQGGQWSSEALKLEILGPETVQAGEEIEYLVKFKNNDKNRLENVDIVFEFPEHTIPQEGRQSIVVEDIDDIYPGVERTIVFKAIPLGRVNDVLEAKVEITYTPKNLNAPYKNKTSLTTLIRKAPLTFEFDLPIKVGQGEELEFSLNYFSSMNTILQGLRVKIEYPNGFTFTSSKPSALDEVEWMLPALSRADGGRIEIKGVLEGSEGSRKIFRAQLGALINNEFVLLSETSQTIEIAEPSLYVSRLINGSQSYIANTGELLHYEIFFKNIGRSPIQKKFLFVELNGAFFDLSSLTSDKGSVGTGDNSIIWDWKVAPSLRFLDSGQEGKVDFWVKVIEEAPSITMKNPVLRIKTTLGGTEKIFVDKINSSPEIAQKVYYEDEVFGNSGPLPPEVGRKTTYTVFWQIKNSWNALENVKVKTTLPASVSVTGRFFPEDSKFTFDSASKEVVWNVGQIEPYQGAGDSEDNLPLTLAFQVELIPDSSQTGSTPLIVGIVELIGEDGFTSDVIEAEGESVDATLPDDEFVSGQQRVIQ